jgi:hypothetical protein
MLVFTLAIIVHMTNVAGTPAPVLRDAQAHVVAMFRDAGISIEWAPESPWASGLPHVVRLTLVPAESDSFRRQGMTPLGAAMRTTSGAGIAWVFYRRVEEVAAREIVPVAQILACAIAHELGHLLQQRVTHTASGVMRPSWSQGDYRRAALGRLQFTPADREQFARFLIEQSLVTSAR